MSDAEMVPEEGERGWWGWVEPDELLSVHGR